MLNKEIKSSDIIDFLAENNVKWVDLRFTDMLGKEQHVTIPATVVDEGFFKSGKMFDGSSLVGWKSIESSDMVLKPVLELPVIDITDLYSEEMAIMRCSVYETNGKPYDRCPRVIASKAEDYLKSINLADAVYVGPELEFFVFDSISFKTGVNESFYRIDDQEGYWNNANHQESNKGFRPPLKGGYFPVAPIDKSVELRNTLCSDLEQMGLTIEAHHHEVATAGQNEIATRFNTLVKKCDEMMIYKYVVQNSAYNKFDKAVTFMPKPIYGDNGSGMHVHISFAKDGQNKFAGDKYAGLSEDALYFIGGVLKHARSLNAFTNPSTNSYKRLVPGFEAPVNLAYSHANRSAAIRIPFVTNDKAKRIEVRFPDGTANPYLAFSAILMAGVDGVLNKIHPGEALDKNLYKLPKEELDLIPKVCGSLGEALSELKRDHAFLTAGGVFTEEFIEEYIQVKQKEIDFINKIPHPGEFELYFAV